MELKDKLQKIFNGDYPGTEVFIRDVICRIFGNEIKYKKLDLAEDTAYHDKAEKAGIIHLCYVADIVEQNYNAGKIALFDVTLDDRKNIERSRVNIQQLIRSVVQDYYHILMVFHYEDAEGKSWRFSYAYKQDTLANTTSAKRYTYVFGRDFRGRTAAERFCVLAQSERKDSDFVDAFSVEALSNEFFDLYRAYYATFVEYIIGEKYTDEKKLNNIIKAWNWRTNDTTNQFATTFDSDAKATRDYIKKMFGRIVFLYFLQRKGWLYNSEGKSDAQYMHHLYEKAEQKGLADRFLDDVLEILFFYILNTKEPEKRIENAKLERGKDVRIIPGWDKIPFLNGGLFQDDDFDRLPCVFPASYFRELFTFLDSYNFTIDENDQEDAEVGIDPEMLGRIFENLLEDNKDKGAFYTPKEIVDYMCRESLIAYLQDDKFSKEGNNLIRTFVETMDKQGLSDDQRVYLRDKLKAVKICDPAIGSGAFPMGLINLLAKLYISLGVSSDEMANIKRHIMEKNIYGVDIEQGAVDIARLRFWLAMVVDESEPTPLPNLHFKIMQGNSLLESFKGKDLSRLMIGTGDLFADSEREQLNKLVDDFYNEQSHTERSYKLEQIRKNIRKQIYFLTNDELSDLDPIANDKFFLWHTWFADVFKNGGFDIVIGNPPYIDAKKLKSQAQSLKTFSIYDGNADIYTYFHQLALNLANEKGIITLITSNKWMRNDYGTKLRILLLKYFIVALIDFNQNRLFNATVDTNIVIVSKSKPCEAPVFSSIEKTAIENRLVNLINEYRVFNIKLDKGYWYLRNDSNKDAIKNRIEKISTRIKDFKVQIFRGILTGCNDAFHIDLELYNIFISNSSQNAEIIYPLVRGSDIYPYRIKYCDKYLINVHNGIRGQLDKIDVNEYPEIKKHLDCYYENLVKRTDKGSTPYNLRNCAYLNKLRQPKIIWQAISKKTDFALDFYGEFICDVTSYFMVGENLEYLLAILNSKLFNYAIMHIYLDGDTFKSKNSIIQNFCVPQVDENVITSIKSIVSKIFEDNTRIELINKIDHIVYHLYELTYDEVLIVDPETPITRKEYETFNLDTYGQS